MNHAELRLQAAQGIASLLVEPSLPVSLRPYQREAIEAVGEWLCNGDDSHRAHISFATGLGKTVTFGSMVAASSGLRSLIIVPSKVLIEQTARSLVHLTGGTVGHLSSLGKIKDDEGAVIATRGFEDQAIVITTLNSFVRHARTLASRFDPQLIIQDECHWAYVPNVQEAYDRFPRSVILAFSATPDFIGPARRGGYLPVALENGRTLYGSEDRFARTHFGPLLDERPLRWGIENGWLAPLAWGRIVFDANLDQVSLVDGQAGLDYSQAELQELMTSHWPLMTETILRLYQQGEYNLPDRQSFAVCPSVNDANELANALQEAGFPSACISGETPTEERNRILRAYARNEIRFISSVMVLREGWDAPNAEVCMMLRPTKSRVLYQQNMGRVLRLDPDNPWKVALILDAFFAQTTFAPLSAPALFGQPGEEVEERAILIGPRNDDGTFAGAAAQSPYLPEGVTPRIMVIPDQIEEDLPWAGPDGTFEMDGEVWGTSNAIAKILNLSSSLVKSRSAGCRMKLGKNASGARCEFHVVSDIERACLDLLNLPQAGPDGTFEMDGEVWGTSNAIARILNLSQPTITKRREDCRIKMGRNASGIPCEFHAVSELRKACADLLEELPQAGEDGTFELDGEVWGTCESLSRLLGVSTPMIRARVRTCRSSKGRISASTRTFHPISEVRTACADLLEELPQAGEDGTFELDGETWGTVTAFSGKLNLSRDAIAKRMSNTTSRKGRNLSGRKCDYIRLSEVRTACADLLEELPQAGEDGTFELDGEVWGTKNSLLEQLKIPLSQMDRRFSALKSIRGKDVGGRVCKFYPISEVRTACADLLEELPQAGEDGTFELDGEVWGTCESLSRLLGVSTPAIKSRSPNCRSRGGKSRSGRREKFLALTDVENACSELLDVVPRAGKDNTFQADGKEWTTISHFLTLHDLNHKHSKTVRLRMCSTKVKKGKARSGHTAEFYPLSDMRKACADLLEEKKKR